MGFLVLFFFFADGTSERGICSRYGKSTVLEYLKLLQRVELL